MANNKKRLSPYSIGSCSILLIFVTICLTTFAALSLVSANSDYNMTKKTADNTTQYYMADSKAQLTLSSLSHVVENNLDKQDFLSACFEDISKLESFSTEQKDGKLNVTYTVPITNRQYLEAKITIEDNINKEISINSWKVITKADDSEESPLNVWNGGLN